MSMFPSPLAYKYARAFLDTVGKEISPQAIQALSSVAQELEGRRDAFLYGSLALDSQRYECIRILIQFLDKFSLGRILSPLVELLAKHKRLPMLAGVLKAIVDIYKRDHKIISVTVTSAQELNSGQKSILEKIIARRFGERLEIIYKLDKILIAGIRVEADGLLWEDTVAHRMQSMRSALARAYGRY
jgi:F-type H+-transporting ATPase subunit delta